ncbi:unnamed protein product [Moneuplotes crassus]|uniref:Uncharacterized protein n=2 Tax=Euplotes crassus TaxID=5936 RepID=A0AAD1XSF4_EUPCR|nr:unnamed protein product [Moneuplotes crassus]
MNNNYKSNIKIINNSSQPWVEIKQKMRYQHARADKCPILEPNQEAELLFIPQLGMCDAPMGVGADQWFQTKDGSQSFYLSWYIPPLNCKPKIKVVYEHNIKVDASFNNKSLTIKIYSENNQKIPEIHEAKVHRKMSEELSNLIPMKIESSSVSKASFATRFDLFSNTTDADSEDLSHSGDLLASAKTDESIHLPVVLSRSRNKSDLGELPQKFLKRSFSQKKQEYIPLNLLSEPT